MSPQCCVGEVINPVIYGGGVDSLPALLTSLGRKVTEGQKFLMRLGDARLSGAAQERRQIYRPETLEDHFLSFHISFCSQRSFSSTQNHSI